MRIEDPIRKIIVERLKELGLTGVRVSLKMGKNRAYLNQYLYRGIPKVLPESIREMLAVQLSLNEERLKYKNSMPNKLQPKIDNGKGLAPIEMPLHLQDLIPVYGYIGGSPEALMINRKNITSYVPRLPSQREDREAYAIKANKDYPECRIKNGDMLYICPHASPVNGQPCLIDHGKTGIRIKEYSPEIALKNTNYIHPIVGIIWI